MAISALDQIPREELASYEKYLQTYFKGGEILIEGRQDDNSIYLLRVGKVGIYRQGEGAHKLIDTIEAINFFGEMALIVGGPRTATVKALSDAVVVYKIQQFDIKRILANATWGEKLITRLCVNLKESTDKFMYQDVEISKLKLQSENAVQKYENILQQSALIFSALNEFQKQIATGAILTSREWHYLVGLHALTQNFIKDRMQDVYETMAERKSSAIADLDKEKLIPERLKEFLA